MSADDTARTEAALIELDGIERRLYATRYADEAINLQGETVAPPRSAPGRGEALATLEEIHNEILCSAELGWLLDTLDAADGLDGRRRAQLRVLRRDRERQMDVPPELQAELTRTQVSAVEAWKLAKAGDDWASFEPYLDKLVDITRKIALIRKPDADPYDTQLDDFEPGSDRGFYDRFFATVKDAVVPVVSDIVEKGWQPDRSCVEGSFDAVRQMELSWSLLALEGITLDAMQLAETEHPFAGSLNTGHAYIATHIFENDLASNIFSILHEGGHALYELGVDPALDYTSLGGGNTMAMHESQSRFFENNLGRSRAFAAPLLSLVREHFPREFEGVGEEEFFLAINRAEPSLIRTEADELTYPLHIIVRYEIEQALFAGEVRAADVPALWREKMRGYFGLEVPNDTLGALQDTHWAGGAFGYFPSYALGSAFAAQFASAMERDGVSVDAACAAGDLTPVRTWLGEGIWRHGRGKDSADVIRDLCGEEFDAGYYARYLTDKFTTMYGLA